MFGVVTEAELESGMAEVCGRLNAVHARLVSLIAAALETRCWEGVGIMSCEHWVAWRTGLSRGRARQLVALARRLPQLPAAAAAFGAGELSVDQVAVVARHTPADHDMSVTEFAKLATVSQLQRSLGSYAFTPSVPVEPTAPAEESDATYVSARFDDDGRYQLRAVLEADDGAVVDAALREAKDALFHRHGVAASGGAALVEIAQRSLGGVESLPRRDAFTALFHVHLDRPPDFTRLTAVTEAAAEAADAADAAVAAEAMRPHARRSGALGPGALGPGAPAAVGTRPPGGLDGHPTGRPVAHLHLGPALPDVLRRQLLCDTRGAVVALRDGRPVQVGRTRRIVPTRTRRLVEDRDRGCRVPGCTNRHIEVHHIVQRHGWRFLAREEIAVTIGGDAQTHVSLAAPLDRVNRRQEGSAPCDCTQG